VRSKKHGTSESASQPNDAVPGDVTVRVPLGFIKGKEFKGIDVGMFTKLSWVGGRQLIISSELAAAL
jgi:hypothetical protein